MLKLITSTPHGSLRQIILAGNVGVKFWDSAYFQND